MTRNKKTMPEGMAKRFDPEGETGDESNRREKAARMSGGLFGLAIGAAQDCPIDIGAQAFTADTASGFALDIDCELFATELAVDHVSEMTNRRTTADSESIPLVRVHRKVKRFKFHERDYIHRLVLVYHHRVNIFSPFGVAK